jgi:chemotaxis protein methyltransferase CheR
MPISRVDYLYLRKLIHDEAGLVLEDDKDYLVESRLTPVVQQEGLASIAELIDCLRARPTVLMRAEVVEAMATDETLFYRDVHPFETLRTTILPELIERRAGGQSLNVWCAAAANGQEPYSLAMLFSRHFPLLENGHLRLIASDISEKALARARQGSYSQVEVDRGLSAELLNQYFHRLGERWQLAEQICRKVEFCKVNLVRQWPFLPVMDLVLIRNVLIYFDEETKAAVLEKMGRLVKPGGYLLLGTSETLSFSNHGFEQVQFDKTVCYRRRP